MKQQEQIEEPKEEKLREKAFLARIAGSIAIIVLCLVGMSFTAYAYFTCSVTSGSNTIKAANFALDVTVDGDPWGDPKTLAAGTHTISIARQEGTTGTGFCVMTVGGQTYHTQQLEQNGASVTFTLELDTLQEVSFMAHWGTSSYYAGFSREEDSEFYITDGKSVVAHPAQTTDTTETDYMEYTVKSGDTLTSIAEAYGTTVKVLQEVNEIENASLIYVGQTIRIPQ